MKLPDPIRLIIFGGRNFHDYNALLTCVTFLPAPVSVVISGTASGADTLGERWALQNGIPVDRFVPLWKTYGKSAGFVRNRAMLVEGRPDYGICLPGGKGTEMMYKLLVNAEVPVIRYHEELDGEFGRVSIIKPVG